MFGFFDVELYFVDFCPLLNDIDRFWVLSHVEDYFVFLLKFVQLLILVGSC